MPYLAGTYWPDFTGYYGQQSHEYCWVWHPDPLRFPKDTNKPYPVFITQIGAGSFNYYKLEDTLGALGLITFAASAREWLMLEQGAAVVAIGQDGTLDPFADGPSNQFQTITKSRGRVADPHTLPQLWQDPNYTNAFLDFQRGTVFLRERCEELYLHYQAWVGYGVSAGGQVLMHSILGPDRGQLVGTGAAKHSTRIAGGIIYDSQSNYYSFSGDDTFENFRPFPLSIKEEDFFIGGSGDNVITKLEDAPTGYLDKFSAMYYGFHTPDQRQLNSNQGAIWWLSNGSVFGSTGTPVTPYANFDMTGSDTTGGGYSFPDQGFVHLGKVGDGSNLGLHDAYEGAQLIRRLRSGQAGGFHDRYSKFNVDAPTSSGISPTGDNWPIQPDYIYGTEADDLVTYQLPLEVNWMWSIINLYLDTEADTLPEYHRDVYGDASIAWVPPVDNYLFNDNQPKRGVKERTFRWEEVQIPLDGTPTGMMLDFVMPDEYVVQITPDIGWHNQLAMFNDPNDENRTNPHLVNIGPLSIENGTLTDNGDGSVQVTLSDAQFQHATIDGYKPYLWRAVPWGNGNPAMGGVPAKFEYVSKVEQLQFTVDPIQKETKRAVQTISGTKGPRVTITTESSNTPSLVVEQTKSSWTVSFIIDRPQVKFTIVATDVAGSAVGKHAVDLEYTGFGQYGDHVWNSFDGFALLASLERLPGESNDSLKERTIDAFANKGATHYGGLVAGINRELGLSRFDGAIRLERSKNLAGIEHEASVQIESNHTRISVLAPSFLKLDEVKRIDSYLETVTTEKRIVDVSDIKTSADVLIPKDKWEVLETVDGNEIRISSEYTGEVKISYTYKEDVVYKVKPTVLDVVTALNAITNPSGLTVVKATMKETMGGHETSTYLYRTYGTLNADSSELFVGWSRVGLFKVSDEEYKWSHADENSMFFDSEFYQFVLELKSRTNIEWGFVVADRDFWDAVDADDYGRDALPIAFDPQIAHYVTAVPIKKDESLDFDPWEAFAMGYYYQSTLLKNVGMPREAFRSGVGFKPDCMVTIQNINVSAKDSKVNLNPVAFDPKDQLKVELSDVEDLIVDL